jgi:hypothetical protein
MGAAELRERISSRLLSEIEDTKFPSTAMLNRVEGMIRDRETLEGYVGALIAKVEATRFPSTDLLNRIERLTARLEQAEQRERQSARDSYERDGHLDDDEDD